MYVKEIKKDRHKFTTCFDIGCLHKHHAGLGDDRPLEFLILDRNVGGQPLRFDVLTSCS